MAAINKPLFILAIVLFAFNSIACAQSSRHINPSSSKKYQPENFSNFFPDTSLASLVAKKLHKKVTDTVSKEELASITGDFEVGPGEYSNLKGIGFLVGIESFSCYKNEITEIPPEFGNLINLRSLDLCKAFALTKISPQIGKLKNLTYLRLSLTEVNNIPKEIGNLLNLETLLICCNYLTEIPKEIGKLKNLKELDIHSNIIKTIPPEICNLTSLTSLNISYCKLEKLPQNIGNLSNLEVLNLFNNHLKQLPPSIKKLDRLAYLNVFDNYKLSESYKTYLPKLLRKKISSKQ